MTRYRECDVCHQRVELPQGVDGSNFVDWGVHKGLDLCPECNPKYKALEGKLNEEKDKALNEFLSS